MRPRISLITLGVDDLKRAVRFYRDGLGLRTEGVVGAEFEYGAVGFFDLQAGLKLALWPRTSIARDAGIAVAAPSPTDFTVAHNVSSRNEVDAVAVAREAEFDRDRGDLARAPEHLVKRGAQARVQEVARAGRREVGGYFTNYDRQRDWHLVPGWLEGREVIAVRREVQPGRFRPFRAT